MNFQAAISNLPSNTKYDSGLFTEAPATQSANGTNGPSGLPMGIMTSDELLAFLQTRLQGLSDRIRDKMSASQNRNDAADKMNRLTQDLTNWKNMAGDREKTANDIKDLLEAHGTDGTLTPDQVAALKTMGGKINDARHVNVVQVIVGLGAPSAEDQLEMERGRVGPNPAELDAAIAACKDQVTSLGKTDELALTELQALVAQMSQATGLTSSMLGSINDTAKSIISKIG